MRVLRGWSKGVVMALAISGYMVPAQEQAPVYPVGGDPAAEIQRALSRSAVDGKHVLLDFGADWCPDCRVLDAQFKDARVAEVLTASYHVVRIDVGRRDKNAALVEKYGATAGEWIPALVVLDPGGRVIGRTDGDVRVSRRTTPEELLAVLERWAPKRHVAHLAQHEQHRIRVSVALEVDGRGRHWVAATYTPVDPGVHLYGTSLPSSGVQGLGRPTVLRVGAARGWTVLGPAVADRIEHLDRIDALDVAVPIYPDGAVTLRVPIRLALDATPEGRVVIGYMGCSAAGCLPPVVDRGLPVRLPVAGKPF